MTHNPSSRFSYGDKPYARDLENIPWHAAPAPPRHHKHWAQTWGWLNSWQFIERCPCGASRFNSGAWVPARSPRVRPRLVLTARGDQAVTALVFALSLLSLGAAAAGATGWIDRVPAYVLGGSLLTAAAIVSVVAERVSRKEWEKALRSGDARPNRYVTEDDVVGFEASWDGTLEWDFKDGGSRAVRKEEFLGY